MTDFKPTDMDDSVAEQSEVLEYYKNDEMTKGAVTVGLYVRVVIGDDTRLTTMGPVDGVEFGWRIVEVNWRDNEMLLAPKTDLQNGELE